MNRFFRKYHRQIAIVFSLPLLLTVVTGMGFTIAEEWLHQRQLARFLIKVHTLEIFNLGEIFPVLNGLGLIGLLVTGIYMSGMFRRRPYLSSEVKK
jgi:Sec-independent protein secretion pathway component TatC